MGRIGVDSERIRRFPGKKINVLPAITVSRQPTTGDVAHEVGTIWRVDSNPTTGAEGDLWYLADKTQTTADWRQFDVGAGGPGVDTLTGDGGTAVGPDGAGDIDITGTTVANATRAKPVYVDDSVATSLDIEVQVAAARTGAPGDKNDAGLCSFDDTSFAVDADGYVTFAAGAITDSFNVDANTGPGTDPVLPDGTGQVTIAGAAVAAHSVPVETHSRAANAFNVEVQVAADRTGAPGNKNDAGLASFDDTSFLVDADGYVTLVGGGGPPALTLTGDSGGAISPDGAGDIDILGGTGITTAGAGSAITVNLDVPVDETNGGTGQTTYTTGDILYASAANTLSKLAIGSTDQVLKVSGGIPAWGADNSTNNNYAVLHEFDDFLNMTAGSGATKLQWTQGGGGTADVAVYTPEAGHTGVCRVSNTGSDCYICLGDGIASDRLPIVLGGGELRVDWIVKIDTASDATNRFTVRLGLANDQRAASITDSVLFVGVDNVNSGQWVVETTASSTSSTGNTSNALDTSWHRYTIIVNAAATSVAFYIDGSEVANSPLTTNIPTASMMPVFTVARNAGATQREFFIDLFEIKYTYTSSR